MSDPGPASPEGVARRPFRLRLPGGERLVGDVWVPDGPTPGEAIVVCHGFKGFKDWGFFPFVAESVARGTGRVTVSFNFTGSGVEASRDRFDRLEKFARNTFTRELADLEVVLDRLAVGRLGEVEVPPAGRFGLLGHSRGGATCILKAAYRRQVAGLVTWASVARTHRYREMYEERWERGETVMIRNARTGQDMPLERNVLDDLRAHPDRLDVPAAAAALEVPYLIVHGTEDESVPAEEARTLAEAAGRHGRVLWVEGAGHTFSVGHPFEGPSADLERAVEATVAHLAGALDGTTGAAT